MTGTWVPPTNIAPLWAAVRRDHFQPLGSRSVPRPNTCWPGQGWRLGCCFTAKVPLPRPTREVSFDWNYPGRLGLWICLGGCYLIANLHRKNQPLWWHHPLSRVQIFTQERRKLDEGKQEAWIQMFLSALDWMRRDMTNCLSSYLGFPFNGGLKPGIVNQTIASFLICFRSGCLLAVPEMKEMKPAHRLWWGRQRCADVTSMAKMVRQWWEHIRPLQQGS